jgi:phosphoribosylanthranilate isomerase
MNVKICGITSVGDAGMVLEAGADAIGVIVDVPVDTPRKISLEKAIEIRDAVSDISHTFIAVLMPETVDEVVKITDALNPDGIQLHGSEEPEFLIELRNTVDCNIIKALHIDGSLDLDYVRAVAEQSDMLLLDTKVGEKVGGTGRTHDYALDNEIKKMTKKRIMLSGGLNPDNVAAAVAAVKPYAVDAASGVESRPGVKDPEKVRKFIEVTACL